MKRSHGKPSTAGARRRSLPSMERCEDRTLLSVTISDAVVAEGDSGSVGALFTLSLDAPEPSRVMVDYVTSDGTARAGTDYVATNGKVFFEPGETTKTISVPVSGDTLSEDDETFFVNICDVMNTTIADGLGQGTIRDDPDPLPSLTIDDVSVAEGISGTTNATFTVSLSGPSGKTVSVDVATVNGTAVAGSDFNAASRTLTFAGGTSQTFTVQVRGDSSFETDEIFQAALTSATNATIARGIGTATIRNDDSPPTLSILSSSVTERDNTSPIATFTVNLSAPSTFPVTVNFSTQDGSAIAGSDYTATSGLLTFNPGETVKIIPVTILSDLAVEPTENFQVVLSNVTGATTPSPSATGTITDNDPKQISISTIFPGQVIEGNSGTRTQSFLIRLLTTSEVPVSVSYATGSLSDTATPGSDYQPTSGTVTFLPGQTTSQVNVQVVGDLVDEALETFSVVLSNPSANAQVSFAVATGTIVDDDPIEPLISVANTSITEGDSGFVVLQFPITLSQPVDVPVTVNFRTAIDNFSPTAASLNDFGSIASGSVTFPARVTSLTVGITISGDTTFEPDEDFLVELLDATPGVTIAVRTARVTILNNDAQPSISISDRAVTEGDLGTVLGFTVSLSNPSSQTISVTYQTASGTATSGVDFTATSGTLTINPGQTSGTITVPIIGDIAPEANETIILDLISAINATLLTGTGATGTIVDDDPAISISDATITEGDSGTLEAVFVVSLNGPNPSQDVRVDYSTVDGSARAGEDYLATSGTLIFSPGTTSLEIRVPIVGDLRFENSESFNVNVSNPVAGSLRDANARGTIVDNDPRPLLSINNVIVAEGAGGSTSDAVFTVSLSEASGLPISLNFFTSDCSATVDLDYSAVGGSITFAPGETSKTISVPVLADTLEEESESFLVNLASISNADVGDSMGQGYISPPVARADLAISATVEPDPAVVGGDLTYTITVSNIGNATADGVTLADILPEGVIFVSASLGSFDPASRSVLALLGTLVPGQSLGLTIVVRPTVLGTLVNTATVSSRTSGPGQTVVTVTGVVNPLIVTNTLDSGFGSLRQVILTANALPGVDTIIFRIPGAGPQTIRPLTSLPAITDPTIVDATTQPGFAGTPIVAVDGTVAGAEVAGLTILAGDSTVKGLAIHSFGGSGILIQGRGGNLIVGSYLGLDPSGAGDRGNAVFGIQVDDVGGNTIGGTTPDLRNVISGNDQVGVRLAGPNASGNRILGNYIGTDASGTAAVANFQGVLILGAPGNLIGGPDPGAGNVISGNTSAGLQILNDATVFDGQPVGSPPGEATDNLVQGNLIGTDATGTSALPNYQGVFINDASGNRIGGTAPGSGNVISGNLSAGIQILGENATRNLIQRNWIGTDRSGTLRLGNDVGVFVFAPPGNVIDRSRTGTGNTIAFNRTQAVRIRTLADGPTVAAVAADVDVVGGTSITGVTLTFAMYLSRSRASDPGNYVVQLLDGRGRRASRVAVVSAEYSEVFRTVHLTLATPLARDASFRVRVRGLAPGGLTDRRGNFLNGANRRASRGRGSDFVAIFRGGEFSAGPVRRTPRATGVLASGAEGRPDSVREAGGSVSAQAFDSLSVAGRLGE